MRTDHCAKMPKRSFEDDITSSPNSSWQDVAESLLRFIDTSKFMMCIDLDYTLWPISCFEQTEGPYSSATAGNIPTKSVSCFNRKDHVRSEVKLYEEACDVLDWCYNSGIPLTICSKCQVEETARSILVELNMWKYFQFPQIYNKRKSTHFKMLKGN